MRPGGAVFVSFALVALAGAARADDAVPLAPDNGQPMVRYRDEGPRPGYHLVQSQMTGFFVASAFFFGLGYLASVGVASNARFENGSAWLLVPVVGPFVGVTKATYCGGFTPPRQPEDCASPIATEGLVALGIAQVVGAVLFPVGFLHRRYWQRDGLVPTLSFQDGVRVGVAGAF